ncbi:MAG: hypothetical protein EA376_05060 [Phycisphaeraceae bacterium]|nr:MAG: hypothetical protein EA376_05060 [Phycisphaeraceae bacterium]
MARKTAARKKTTRKKTTARKKTTKKAATRRATIPGTKKARTKSEFFKTIAENTDLTRKQVADVFDVASQMMAKDLGTSGPGVVNFGGLMKVTVQKKPATRARKGINPFTGEETMFKAKPARKVVKVRPLKALKSMV